MGKSKRTVHEGFCKGDPPRFWSDPEGNSTTASLVRRWVNVEQQQDVDTSWSVTTGNKVIAPRIVSCPPGESSQQERVVCFS